MDKRTERQAVKDCLATPGARLLADKLKKAADDALLKYDKCKPEDLVRLQMLRYLINEEFPRLIENIVNPIDEPSRFNWRRLLGLK